MIAQYNGNQRIRIIISEVLFILLPLNVILVAVKQTSNNNKRLLKCMENRVEIQILMKRKYQNTWYNRMSGYFFFKNIL